MASLYGKHNYCLGIGGDNGRWVSFEQTVVVWELPLQPRLAVHIDRRKQNSEIIQEIAKSSAIFGQSLVELSKRFS